MKKDIKKLWVEDLLSGNHGQTVGALKVGKRFCCLGRLCDLSVEYGIGVWVTNKYGTETFVCSDGRGNPTDTLNRSVHCLPKPVAEWAGLGDDPTEVGINCAYKGKNYFYLSNMNDSGITFPEIAEVIREQL